MKYKPGDKVRIKSLVWYNANKNEKGIIPCGDYNFAEFMTPLCGKIVTITDFEYDSGYIILEDDMVNAWTDEMIEGLADAEPHEKMVSLEDAAKWLEENLDWYMRQVYIVENMDTADIVDDFRKAMEEK